jgi:hypothetical protein
MSYPSIHRTTLPAGLALLFMTVGCGSELPDPEDRSASTAANRTSTVGEQMTLTGCVGGGDSPGQYQLKEIRVEPGRDVRQDPQGDSLVPGVTQGAWVRLEGRESELERLLGQRVRITGEITSTGDSTIGTSGAFGYETPSGDASRAASDEHYSEKQKLEAGRIARQSLANGRAATLQVGGIALINEPCQTFSIPERR